MPELREAGSLWPRRRGPRARLCAACFLPIRPTDMVDRPQDGSGWMHAYCAEHVLEDGSLVHFRPAGVEVDAVEQEAGDPGIIDPWHDGPIPSDSDTPDSPDVSAHSELRSDSTPIQSESNEPEPNGPSCG